MQHVTAPLRLALNLLSTEVKTDSKETNMNGASRRKDDKNLSETIITDPTLQGILQSISVDLNLNVDFRCSFDEKTGRTYWIATGDVTTSMDALFNNHRGPLLDAFNNIKAARSAIFAMKNLRGGK